MKSGLLKVLVAFLLVIVVGSNLVWAADLENEDEVESVNVDGDVENYENINGEIGASTSSLPDFSNAKVKLEYSGKVTGYLHSNILITVYDIDWDGFNQEDVHYFYFSFSNNELGSEVLSEFNNYNIDTDKYKRVTENGEQLTYELGRVDTDIPSTIYRKNGRLYFNLYMRIRGEDNTEWMIKNLEIERLPLWEFGNRFSYTLGSGFNTIFCHEFQAPNENIDEVYYKIFKVNDSNLLNKIRNNSNGWQDDLLSYAKINNAEESGKSRGDSTGSLEPNSFYALYMYMDDNNGEFYPIEDIVFGKTDSVGVLQRFSWDDASTSSDIPTRAETTDGSNSEATPTSLPKAGKASVGVGVALVCGMVWFSFRKLKKYRDVK